MSILLKIARKICAIVGAGIFVAIGGAIGVTIGGDIGAIVGMLIGAGIGMFIFTAIDKANTKEELRDNFLMLRERILLKIARRICAIIGASIFVAIGGVIGGTIGGDTGVIIGMFIGVSVGIVIFISIDEARTKEELRENFLMLREPVSIMIGVVLSVGGIILFLVIIVALLGLTYRFLSPIFKWAAGL